MGFAPERLGVIHTAPVVMNWSERVVLFGTIFGLRPRRCLEIGSHRGGSATIIVAALDDIGDGKLACVDPNPLIAPHTWEPIAHRATLFAGPSPDILQEAREAMGGPFDFVLIDGDHELEGVTRDIEGVLPLLANHAYLLFHDAHFHKVRDGIDQMLLKYPKRLVDCGMVSVEQVPDDNEEVTWGGLRMVRFSTEKSPRPKLMDLLRDTAAQTKIQVK